MKGFVQDALAGTIRGFIDSLKIGSKDPKTIEIRITLTDKSD